MTVADGGRTVIVPGPDQNFDRRVDPEGSQRDAGIPQALYMENVMPTTNGYQSVGYIRPTSDMIKAPARYIIASQEIYVGKSEKTMIFQDSLGDLTSGYQGTESVTVVGTAPSFNTVFTSASVNGVSYLYSSLLPRLYTATVPVLTLTEITASVTPTNFLSIAGIKFILGFANYLIAVSDDRIYWSSLTTPTDFTASLVSGSGSIVPNNLTGTISRVAVSSEGFYLFTAFTCVFVQYTGNARYPFKFTSVTGFDGLKFVFPFIATVWGDINSSSVYAVNSDNSVKVLNRATALPVDPQLSDFLCNTVVQETFNYATNQFTVAAQSTRCAAVHFHANRYLVVSINDNTETQRSQYTHALIIDTVLRRTGRLKVLHKFTFSCDLLFGPLFATKGIIGFVDGEAGVIKYCSLTFYDLPIPLDANYEPAQGALLLGKFQYVRSSMMKMEEIEIEGPQNTAIVSSPNFSCALIPSQDGRNFDTPIPLSPTRISGGLVEYHCHNTAKNHSLLLKGAFSVNTVQLKFVTAGDR
jgi:hypothetical protein